jgi:DNA-binding SARP family transcriptional activator
LRGEFLDGLDMPRCYRFHHWCMAKRERFGTLRRQVLGALIARLKHDPERVLPYARALVAADPLSEAAHAVLVKVLAEGGRTKDAEAHYAHARVS